MQSANVQQYTQLSMQVGRMVSPQLYIDTATVYTMQRLCEAHTSSAFD